MSVRCILDASSGHLSPQTWTWLDEQTSDEVVREPGNRGGRTRHGWFIYAAEAPAAPIPADLATLMQYARQQDCDYVLLDCDSLPMADLAILHPDFQDPPAAT